MTEDEITELSRLVGRLCHRRKVVVTTAESCTAGGLAAAITRIGGSAKWFERGFVTYSNTAKHEMLGVSRDTLANNGAVSAPVAQEMAQGALRNSPADIAISITGIAGPTGGSRTKPVGTVWFCWAHRGGEPQARVFRFKGDRIEVRRQSIAVALMGLRDLLAPRR